MKYRCGKEQRLGGMRSQPKHQLQRGFDSWGVLDGGVVEEDQYAGWWILGDSVANIGDYTTLHCTALHCTALHCTALHCSVCKDDGN